MPFNHEIRSYGGTDISQKPQVSSYDTCHEHSIEHWIELRMMVEEFAVETNTIAEPEMARTALA